MSNKILTDDIIVKDALRLLVNNTVMAPLVYRDYERRFGKVGDTIRLEQPYRTKSAEGAALQVQPAVDQNTTLEINRQRHFAIEFGQKERTLSIQLFRERYLRSGIVQIANVIDESICLTLKNIAMSSGTPGTNPGSYLTFANAAAKQTMFAVPDDEMRRAVTNPTTCATLSNEVKGLYNEQMVRDTYVKGYYGDVAGYSLHKTQNLPTHTVGSHGGTPLVNGASQTGTSLVTDGWTINTTVLKAGDVIRLASVNGVNPQNYNDTGYQQEFVVQNDVTSDGSGNATITIYPGINDGTNTTTNTAGQTVSLAAYQNVTAAPADNAAITVIGTADTTYRQDYLFHKEAIALAMIDLEMPEAATVKSRARDPQTGMSMLLTGDFDIVNYKQIYRIDALWGTKAIYPELGMRLWGESV